MKAVCVYCGSGSGRLEAYAEAAKALGTALVARDLTLVYGGASIGLMGLIADTVLAAGGRAIGVMPDGLARREVAHKHLTELHITQTMHQRKTLMAELADGFVALPGGLGTLEELFEVWTWSQLGIHAKPCGMLNAAGYYDGLLTFLDHATAEAFVRPQHREALLVDTDAERLLDQMASWRHQPETKWLSERQT